MRNGVSLYVLQHGECEHNVAKVVAGRSDTPLTARGCEQSRQGGLLLGALLKDPSAVDFVSSSAPRARTTLELVVAASALGGVTCRADERLVENDFLGDVRRDTVVVAHRWPVVALRGLALGLPERDIWDFEAKNAAVIEIRDGRRS